MRRIRPLVMVLAVALLAPMLVVTGVARGATAAAQETATTCSIEGFPGETVEIMAPAAPGGGWDTTAREMAQVLQEGIVDQTVEVFNVAGAGGTIGLAQLTNEQKGNERLLMMMGLVMVGAIETNQSPVSLADTTPIARLTTEYEVIVVPADSPYQTLEALIADFQADPGAISWAGGSAGGTDHILAGLIAKAVGVDPAQVNYIAYSGGGEALAAILGGQVSAGISGLGEWQDQIATGELRALAISAPGGTALATPAAGATPTPALAIPTLQDQGVDVELANWRGVVAPPEISQEARDCLIAMVEQMRASDAWAAVLARYSWQDFFLTGDEYGDYLNQERERVAAVLQELGLVG